MNKTKNSAKVKNPCKICSQSVNPQSGLQCKGACKKWAHFTCLNYTPGKIQDIKAGIIKVICPCPNCVTAGPKEIVKDPPYVCENEECPLIEDSSCPNSENPSIQSVQCPGVETEGIKEKNDQKIICQSANTSPINVRPPPRGPSDTCCPNPPCKEDNKKVPQKISQSCACLLPSDDASPKNSCSSSSDSQLPSMKSNQKILINAVRQLCNTVGQLSTQIKDLMCKMIEAFEKSCA